jgi:hypothetical protein
MDGLTQLFIGEHSKIHAQMYCNLCEAFEEARVRPDASDPLGAGKPFHAHQTALHACGARFILFETLDCGQVRAGSHRALAENS